jgi:very-short-patch-repair endonuclease
MSIDEAALAGELSTRNGVTTAARLERLGISQRSSRTLVVNGRVVRIARGVFAASGWPDSLDHRIARACAVTGGVVCFPTAGEAWDLRKTPRCPDVHVWIESDRRLERRPGMQMRHTSHLPSCDIVRRSDDSCVTSPPRTAFDAAGLLDADDLESLIEQCLDRRYFLITTLWEVTRRVGQPGRAGSGRIAAVIGRRPLWTRPVESDYELRLERALVRRGFPRLVRQHRLELATGEIVHPDLGIPELGFFVEVDHLSWHGGRHETAYDRDRDLRVRASGYDVERVTDLAIDGDLDTTVERLWQVLQRVRSRAVTA